MIMYNKLLRVLLVSLAEAC